MKHLLTTLLFLCYIGTGNAQTEVDQLIREGVSYHDAGDYGKAISTYKKALKIDPNSAMANYEISMSYMYSGDHEKALKHAEFVLDQKGNYLLEASMVKGSCLDYMGKTKESIRFFEKAIDDYGPHYLLSYNLAMNCFKIGELSKAEGALLDALSQNPAHSSSHLILGYVCAETNRNSQSLLSFYYFLLLEPTSERAGKVFQFLENQYGLGVEKDKKKENTININLNSNPDESFIASDLMVAMVSASRYTAEHENESDEEFFLHQTESFFKILGELRKPEHKGLWWDLYVDFFYDLAQSEHLEAFCNYISSGSNRKAENWLQNNEAKMTDFANWLQDR